MSTVLHVLLLEVAFLFLAHLVLEHGILFIYFAFL